MKSLKLPIPLAATEVNCPLCGKSQPRTLLPFDSFGFKIETVECTFCGLVYSNPRPTEEYLAGFYRESYRYFYEGVREISDQYADRRKLPQLAAARVERYAEILEKCSAVLDVGCGAGFFLAEVKRRYPHLRIQGIEPDGVAADKCEKLGVPVFRGLLGQFDSSDGFDFVTAFHIVEHVYDLAQFFALIRQHQNPGGFVAVETPNCLGSWQDIGMFHIAHLQTFSLRSLESLLGREEFAVLTSGELENGLETSNLYVAARRSERALPLKPFDSAQSLRLRKKCESVQAVRTARVLRTWAKWAYYRLGGVQP